MTFSSLFIIVLSLKHCTYIARHRSTVIENKDRVISPISDFSCNLCYTGRNWEHFKEKTRIKITYISDIIWHKKSLYFLPKYFFLISLHFILCKLHMDIGTCHLSLVSPLYAAKLVVSYMLHRDTGRAQSKMTQPSYLSPHPPTSQHSLSQQTHPVHCWAPMWQGPCLPSGVLSWSYLKIIFISFNTLIIENSLG